MRALAIALLSVVLIIPSAALQAESRAAPDPALQARVQEAFEADWGFEDRFDAEVWLGLMSTRLTERVPDPERRQELLRWIHHEAHRADLPPELVLAVIEVESGFDRFAISHAGARGLMQVMPFWLEVLERSQANLFDPPTNLRIGCTILRYYLDKEQGDLVGALARYNGSYGQTWYPERVLDALSERWFAQ